MGANKTWFQMLEQYRAEYLAGARAIARKLGRKGAVVTIDQVREKCPPPDDVDPRVMGAVFSRSEWERVGYTWSRRRTCHHRPIAEFRLRE